jgi:membrane fusion protein (multidrug efflux system)
VVTQGVSAGERVVVEGFQKVRPGMVVAPKPVPPELADGAPSDAPAPTPAADAAPAPASPKAGT